MNLNIKKEFRFGNFGLQVLYPIIYRKTCAMGNNSMNYLKCNGGCIKYKLFKGAVHV